MNNPHTNGGMQWGMRLHHGGGGTRSGAMQLAHLSGTGVGSLGQPRLERRLCRIVFLRTLLVGPVERFPEELGSPLLEPRKKKTRPPTTLMVPPHCRQAPDPRLQGEI